jgi:hypothetical protein
VIIISSEMNVVTTMNHGIHLSRGLWHTFLQTEELKSEARRRLTWKRPDVTDSSADGVQRDGLAMYTTEVVSGICTSTDKATLHHLPYDTLLNLLLFPVEAAVINRDDPG